jgi:hypothetical protein
MKLLMTGVVNRVYTFLTRTIFSQSDDAEFLDAIERAVVPWTKAWDEPQYLPDFLMPRLAGEDDDDSSSMKT